MTATIMLFPESRIVRDPKTVAETIELELELERYGRAEQPDALGYPMMAAEPGEYYGSALGKTVSLVLATREDHPSPVHCVSEYLLAAKFDSGQRGLLVVRGPGDNITWALHDIDQAFEDDEEAMEPEAAPLEPSGPGRTMTVYDGSSTETGEVTLFAEFDYGSLARWAQRHGWRMANHMTEIEEFFELVPAS